MAEVDEHSSDEQKNQALKLACYADAPEAIAYLLFMGANPNTDVDINHLYKKSQTFECPKDATPLLLC